MKWKLIAILLFIAAFLTACGYIVVEDPNRQTIGSLFSLTAQAEESESGADIASSRSIPVPEAGMPTWLEDSRSDTATDNHSPIHELPLEAARRGVTPETAPTATPGEADNQTPAISEPETPPMARGASGEEVKALQERLRVLGFLSGKADGVFGAQTEDAVKRAQAHLQAQKQAEAAAFRAKAIEKLSALSFQAAESLNALAARVDDGATPSEAPLALEAPIQPKSVRMTFISPDISLAPKPQTFKADGVVTDELLMYLENGLDEFVGDLAKGAKGADVTRLQTRLNCMHYLLGGIDGEFGGNTQLAVKYFQKFNGLDETGVADEVMQRMLFSPECKLSNYPMYEYRVDVDVSRQRVYVYRWNFGSYSSLVKTMKCSTGTRETPTPIGSFKMSGPCGRWYYFKEFECWAQYAYRIYSGILFHSVLYSEKDTSTLRQGSVNALGSRASHGCVRLSVADAKWLYNNVPAGTTCRIYN